MKKQISIILTLALVIVSPGLFGQEKASIRLDLTYHQLNNQLPELKAQIRTRIDRRYQPVEGVKVNFYHSEVSEENFLGASDSDLEGFASLIFPDNFKTWFDTSSVMTYHAIVSDDPNYDDKDDDIDITKSIVEISLDEGEEREVEITINKFDEEGNQIPAEEVDVQIFVKRTFGRLEIGSGFETDEDGKFTTDFPSDIPGDSLGRLTIVAFVEDDRDLGYLNFEKEADWGVITLDNNEEFEKRTLWASRDKAPFWLLIFPNLIILGIWGTMVYLLWLIYRINKLGKSG